MMKASLQSKSERGVALIITLILLSVITFMAVAFLVISRHASEAVTSVTQQAVAKQAAADALQTAEAGVIASMLARGEGFDFGPQVSQNYQSQVFTNGSANVANVNYFVDDSGNPLNANEYLQMLNNLLVQARPPVFISTNAGFPLDFRFFLDLNRNGMFDPSEPVQSFNQFNQPEFNTAGDPEWIGVLEHPDQPHSRSNYFAARFAFFAQPIGNSLDIDYIHNTAKQILSGTANPGLDGFLRNQGVGSWEINLAGFLNGLNPNYWDYQYQVFDTGGALLTTPSTGRAFQDSANILDRKSVV